jgi:hypothetical protein
MAKINYLKISEAIASSSIGEKRVKTVAQRKFQDAHKALMNDFDNHEVTREIENGFDAENISGTLRTKSGEGNLFSFIGFNRGSRPVKPVRDVLQNDLTLTYNKKNVSAKQMEFSFSIKIPKEKIEQASPIPFEPGQSWVFGIEKGISDFSSTVLSYIRKNMNTPPSVSGGGIQIKNQVSGNKFIKTKYLTEILNKFKTRFSGK